MKLPAWLNTHKSRHLTLAVFATALLAFGALVTPSGNACASDTAPTDYCFYTNVTVTYSGPGTVDNQAIRGIFNGGDLIANDAINDLAWDLRPYIGVVSNEVNVEAQSLGSSGGWWFQVPTISTGETRTIRQLMGSNEQKRDQGVLMTGGETITTPDDDSLDLTDMLTWRASLIVLDDTSRNETIAYHHDGGDGFRIDLIDNAGSLEVQCTADATTVSIAFDPSWVDTVRDFACSLDSIADGLTILEEVSGTTASTAASPIGSAVAADLIVGDGSLSSAILLDFRLLDDRVRMSSLGVPTVIIDRFVLSAASASETLTVDTSNLPFPPRHLMLSCNVQTSAGNPELRVTINGDAGFNYNEQSIEGAAAVAAGARLTNAGFILLSRGNANANQFASSETLFIDALSTRTQKSFVGLGGENENQVTAYAGRWANTDAITHLAVSFSGANIAADSTCELSTLDERYSLGESILSGAGSFTFAPPNRNGYVVAIGNLRSANAAVSDTIEWEFNNDTTTANYAKQQLDGTNAATSAASSSDNFIGIVSADSAGADEFGALLATFQNGYIAQNDPSYLTLSGFHESTGPNSSVRVISGRRNNVEGVLEIDLIATTGSDFTADSGLWPYFVPTTIQEVVTLDVAAASITFSGIEPAPALRFHIFGRTDRVGSGSAVRMRFNGDATAANYDLQILTGNGAAVTASQSAADEVVLDVPASLDPANSFGGGVVVIQNSSAADRHKARLSISGWSPSVVTIRSSRWESTPPITTTTLTVGAANFVAGTVALLETADGFGTVVRYGYDAVGMTELTAVDPTYTGTFDGYGVAALTANYSFSRDQSDWQVNVGPLIPANVNPGPVDPDELLDILGDPFGDLIDSTVAEDVTGIFYSYFVIPVNALDPLIGRQFAWTLLIGGFAIVFMVAAWLPFKQVAVSVFAAGIPLVYGATQGYITWWWVIFWMIMVPVAWFATKASQEA